ncbi:MAG: SDR family NAD(P)-dependent oxidoreductase [Bifidobacteriaceae bacterium]|jgi:NAD(P)-dependent dehydrogenase (short-subunit alcohol dehydrogenase family)|nr:SDR family NAD(P)-dependent oxidoreductase [Bifidobacteriaceae bacterium]
MSGPLAAWLLGVSPAGAPPDRLAAAVRGRLVVVTGASRGVGRELAVRLAATGAQVVGLARTEEPLAALRERAARAGRRFDYLVCDLRETDAAAAAAGDVLERWGVPAIHVAAAGHSIHRRLDQYVDRFHDVLRTAGANYLGPAAFAAPLAHAMARAGEGHVIGVSTTSVDLPGPAWSAYEASKAAFDVWLGALAPELARSGVAVTSVHLPRVATAMSAPTAGRYPVPELTCAQAASLLGRAIVERPRLIAPWWARLGGAVWRLQPALPDAAWSRLPERWW